MTRLPVLAPSDVIRVLERAGFIFLRQRGSHRIYAKGQLFTVVPVHPGDMRIGTLRHIVKQSGMTVEDFLKYL